MYKFVKSLNNNLVLAFDEKNEEVVLVGKGIGFKKKKGEMVDETLITKVFRSEGNQAFTELMQTVDPDIILVTEKIIRLGEEKLGKKLNTSILFSLADHLQSAVERTNSNKTLIENNIQWEIPFLYYKEHKIGLESLKMIEEELGLSLSELEASFIALHFVNAQDGIESMEETIKISKITKSMIKIIQSLFDVSLNKKSVNYARFITHIRYFMNRQLHHKGNEGMDTKLYRIVQEEYPRSYACSLMIREMLLKEYGLKVNDDEMLYLIIHIERVVSETKKEHL